MLVKGRKQIMNMFLFAINGTTGIISTMGLLARVLTLFYPLGKLTPLINFSIGGYIFILISIFPFLFKNDGFHLFQEITQVRKIRSRFFKLLFYPFSSKSKKDWQKNSTKEKIVIVTWGCCFIVTIITLEYIISNGIRIII